MRYINGTIQPAVKRALTINGLGLVKALATNPGEIRHFGFVGPEVSRHLRKMSSTQIVEFLPAETLDAEKVILPVSSLSTQDQRRIAALWSVDFHLVTLAVRGEKFIVEAAYGNGVMDVARPVFRIVDPLTLEAASRVAKKKALKWLIRAQRRVNG